VTTSSAVAEDRLERPDRLPVGEPAHDPVALRPRIGGPLPASRPRDASELLHRARPFPGERVQPFVGEDHGQLVGVLGLDRHQQRRAVRIGASISGNRQVPEGGGIAYSA
jgi:hypothetical protein